MKFNQILRLLFFLLAIAYLVMLHFQNPTPISLPFFISLPPAIVAAAAFLLGFLTELIPSRMALWRKSRELRKIKKEISKLQEKFPSFAGSKAQEVSKTKNRFPSFGAKKEKAFIPDDSSETSNEVNIEKATDILDSDS